MSYYIQPLFILEDTEHPGDPDYRIVSSRNPAMGEDRSQADLIDTNNSLGAKDDEFKGNFYLPLEMKFHQVHCPPDGSECPPE